MVAEYGPRISKVDPKPCQIRFGDRPWDGWHYSLIVKHCFNDYFVNKAASGLETVLSNAVGITSW